MSARDKLIDTTEALLSKQGYEATSPRDIQRVSGVGQGSFYHHFDSKADLASTALVGLAEKMCAEFDRLTEHDGSSQIDHYLKLDRDATAGCRIGRISMESSIADDRIRQPIASYFQHLRRELSEAFVSLETGIPAADLADLAIATVQGSFVVARCIDDESAMERATSALLALIKSVTSEPLTGDK